jgi:hypothetical protein
MAEYFTDPKAWCQKPKPIQGEIYGGAIPIVMEDLGLEDLGLKFTPKRRAAAAAMFLCEVCPVKGQCHDFGVENGLSGIFGGEYLVNGQPSEPVDDQLRHGMQRIIVENLDADRAEQLRLKRLGL